LQKAVVDVDKGKLVERKTGGVDAAVTIEWWSH